MRNTFWSLKNGLQLNAEKSASIIISSIITIGYLGINNTEIECSKKSIGIIFDKNVMWEPHVNIKYALVFMAR